MWPSQRPEKGTSSFHGKRKCFSKASKRHFVFFAKNQKHLSKASVRSSAWEGLTWASPDLRRAQSACKKLCAPGAR